LFSFSQNNRNKDVDKYVTYIDKNVKAKKFTVKQLNHMSALGGAVTGYYANKKLVFIETTYGGMDGYHSFNFYISSDTLVFVTERNEWTKIPENQDEYDRYIKTHTNKNGDVDMTKLPLAADDYNTYYIDNNTIVGFSFKSFGKLKTQIFEDDIANKNKEIVQHYQSHLKELNE